MTKRIKPFTVQLGSEITFEIHGDESVGVQLGARYLAFTPEQLRLFLVELRDGYRASV